MSASGYTNKRRTRAQARVVKAQYPGSVANNYDPLFSSIDCNSSYTVLDYKGVPGLCTQHSYPTIGTHILFGSLQALSMVLEPLSLAVPSVAIPDLSIKTTISVTQSPPENLSIALPRLEMIRNVSIPVDNLDKESPVYLPPLILEPLRNVGVLVNIPPPQQAVFVPPLILEPLRNATVHIDVPISGQTVYYPPSNIEPLRNVSVHLEAPHILPRLYDPLPSYEQLRNVVIPMERIVEFAKLVEKFYPDILPVSTKSIVPSITVRIPSEFPLITNDHKSLDIIRYKRDGSPYIAFPNEKRYVSAKKKEEQVGAALFKKIEKIRNVGVNVPIPHTPLDIFVPPPIYEKVRNIVIPMERIVEFAKLFEKHYPDILLVSTESIVPDITVRIPNDTPSSTDIIPFKHFEGKPYITLYLEKPRVYDQVDDDKPFDITQIKHNGKLRHVSVPIEIPSIQNDVFVPVHKYEKLRNVGVPVDLPLPPPDVFAPPLTLEPLRNVGVRVDIPMPEPSVYLSPPNYEPLRNVGVLVDVPIPEPIVYISPPNYERLRNVGVRVDIFGSKPSNVTIQVPKYEKIRYITLPMERPTEMVDLIDPIHSDILPVFKCLQIPNINIRIPALFHSKPQEPTKVDINYFRNYAGMRYDNLRNITIPMERPYTPSQPIEIMLFDIALSKFDEKLRNISVPLERLVSNKPIYDGISMRHFGGLLKSIHQRLPQAEEQLIFSGGSLNPDEYIVYGGGGA